MQVFDCHGVEWLNVRTVIIVSGKINSKPSAGSSLIVMALSKTADLKMTKALLKSNED